jgi:hypothetical protein
MILIVLLKLENLILFIIFFIKILNKLEELFEFIYFWYECSIEKIKCIL